MLRNYFTIALRQLRRRKLYAAINIVGLAIGMAGCLLMLLYVRHELSFDRHHPDVDRLFRIVQDTETGGTAWTGGGLAGFAARDVPEFVHIARLHRTERLVHTTGADSLDRRFREPRFFYTDPALFDLFDLPFVSGDPATALAEPNTVVLTESTAEKYFGARDPVGQTLSLDGTREVRVTGVLRDLPATTHLDVDLLTSLETFKLEHFGTSDRELTSFYWPTVWTYVALRPGADAAAVDARLPDILARHQDESTAADFRPRLQPVTDIHLRSALNYEMTPNSSIGYVYVFSAVALFILLIGCVNFTNLATAHAAERAREVGVRKALGAQRRQLQTQFFGESLVLSLFAVVLAAGLVEICLPGFNTLAGRTLDVSYLDDALYPAALLTLVVLVAFAAGGYPALLLSRYRPALVLKGRLGAEGGGARLRKSLVVFQFTVSVLLIIGTAVAYQQVDFLRNARLGFDQHALLTVDASGAEARFGVLRARLLQHPAIEAVEAASVRPGITQGGGYPFEIENTPSESGEQTIRVQFVTPGFFDLLGVETVTGRSFDEAFPSDLGRAVDVERLYYGSGFVDRGFLMNETAARSLGWSSEEALGKAVRIYTEENGTLYMDHRGMVVGVVRDYHAASLREEIAPILYARATAPNAEAPYVGSLLVRAVPGALDAARAHLADVWREVVPDQPLDAAFLDESLAALYRSEDRTGRIIAVSGGLALLIACLGLFGLAAYTVRRRTKEIGVRKVLGASSVQIMLLLTREVVWLVVIALAVAGPLAYLGTERWLSAFAYRVEPGAFAFLLGGGITLGVALLTISTLSLRAARSNPADALRTE